MYCTLHCISSFISPIQFSFFQAPGSPDLDIWIGQIFKKPNRTFLQRIRFVGLGKKEGCQNKVCFSSNWNHQSRKEQRPTQWTLCLFISNTFVYSQFTSKIFSSHWFVSWKSGVYISCLEFQTDHIEDQVFIFSIFYLRNRMRPFWASIIW